MPDQEADIKWDDPRKNSVKRESAIERLDTAKSRLNEMGDLLDRATRGLNEAQERLAVAKSLYRQASDLVYCAYNDVYGIGMEDVELKKRGGHPRSRMPPPFFNSHLFPLCGV